jgi:hypothetical protein
VFSFFGNGRDGDGGDEGHVAVILMSGVRVPTPEQELARCQSRQREQLMAHRLRLEARCPHQASMPSILNFLRHHFTTHANPRGNEWQGSESTA